MSAVEEYRVMWKDDPPETREAASVVKYADAAIAELEAALGGRPFPRCPNLDCKEWASLKEKNRAGWEDRARKADADPAEIESDFPCTYCRGMTQHDSTCELLVIRVTADLRARAEAASRSRDT